MQDDASKDTKLRLSQRIATVIWFLLGLGFLLAVPVLPGLHPLLLPAILILAALLAVPAAALILWLFDRDRRSSFLAHWIKAAAGLGLLLPALAAAPLYALAIIAQSDPLVAPQAVLSNGKKTVLFQGAVHIGSEPFYKAMVYDLEHALSDGYVIYYEGVLPDPAGDAFFRQMISGGGDLNDTYKAMGKVCGLTFQGDYFRLLAPQIAEHPDRHVAADVTTLQLKQEYERLAAADPAFAAKVHEAADKDKADNKDAGTMAKFFAWAQDGDPRHKTLAGVTCRGAVTVMLKLKEKQSATLDPLVLDFRNRELAARIAAAPQSLIYVNYGAGHLKGLLADLRKADPNWKVESVKWMRALQAPEDLHGEIID